MNASLNGDLEKLTDEIVASYDADDRTQRIGREFLPSQEKIVQVLMQIRQALFPGYFGPAGLTRENVKFTIGSLLMKLGEELTEQIYRCLCYAEHLQEAQPCRLKAEKVGHDFLRSLPALRANLALDAQAAYDGDPAAKSTDEVIYCYPGFMAVWVYRVAHRLLELGVPLMPRIMTEYAHGVTGCDIHPGAAVGKSFFIDHATGVVIGETTHIGDNVKIYQGVTLGAKSFPKDERGRVIKGIQRHPTIRDNVTIYANATILGGETVIGDGVIVGGNTFITSSIMPESTVVHETPRLQVKSRDGRKK